VTYDLGFWPTVRACSRLVVLAVFTGVVYLTLVVWRWIVGWSSPRGREVRRRCVRTWFRGVCRVIGMRLHLSGEPPVAPFLLVSNHLSYVDILAYGATVDCVFVAKSDLASWPVVGSLCRVADVVFVDRKIRRDVSRVNALVGDAIRNGEGVIVFPEGTSTRGETVLPFMSSLLDVAAKTAMPVHAATIWYRTAAPERPASESICWWGDMTFPDHFFALVGMSGFDAWITHSNLAIRSEERKQLAQLLRERVLEAFVPVVTAGSGDDSAEESLDNVHGELAS
jgi:1-acyl-sn-glycerol-3-phosphate acyltransferase